MGLGGRIPPWLVLLSCFVAGLGLSVAPHIWEWRWDYGITREIGVALIVAAILGFTIDRWLKAELRTDAFLAAIGHVLAPEFRAEVSRIIGYKLICERHYLLVQIKSIGSGLVKINSSAERHIRNKSAYPQTIKSMAHIDDWDYPGGGQAKVTECELEIGDLVIRAAGSTRDAYSVLSETEEKIIKPDQVAILRTKWEEYKPVNDDLYYHFATPTINPEIEVQLTDDLECIFGFGTAGNVTELKYAPRKQLKGTYFPHQAMRVRWWPKRKM